MASRTLKEALSKELPVLFVNIGWAIRYDGTETMSGNHRYFRERQEEAVSEARAFKPDANGIFRATSAGET